MLKLRDLAFLSGLLGLLFLLLLLLVPKMVSKPPPPPPPPTPRISSLDVSCWCPSQFTDSMVTYTNNFCKNSLLNNETYMLRDDVSFITQRVDIYEDLEVLEDKKPCDEKPCPKQTMKYVFVFELLILVAFYTLVSIGQQGSGAIYRVVGILGHVIGVVFFFLASFVTYVSLSGEREPDEPIPQPQSHGGVAMCDMSIRQLGNEQRYTVQCAYSFETSPKPLHVETGINAYLALNGVICGTIVILSLGSFASIFTQKSKKDEAAKTI